VITNKYEHAVDGGNMFDITQFYWLFAAGLAFFEVLFVLNMRKPKRSE